VPEQSNDTHGTFVMVHDAIPGDRSSEDTVYKSDCVTSKPCRGHNEAMDYVLNISDLFTTLGKRWSPAKEAALNTTIILGEILTVLAKLERQQKI
jgi:hypothetical protein